MVFCVSLSGCMVSFVICFSVIVLKDRRLCDFLWFEKRYFSERRGMCSFLVFSRWFFGCFCGVKIEL